MWQHKPFRLVSSRAQPQGVYPRGRGRDWPGVVTRAASRSALIRLAAYCTALKPLTTSNWLGPIGRSSSSSRWKLTSGRRDRARYKSASKAPKPQTSAPFVLAFSAVRPAPHPRSRYWVPCWTPARKDLVENPGYCALLVCRPIRSLSAP